MSVYRGADFWVGYLAHTVAVATTSPHKQAILENAVKDFLDGVPAEGDLADVASKVRLTLKEKR